MTPIISAILALALATVIFLAAVVWCGAALSKLMAEMEPDEGNPGRDTKRGGLERPARKEDRMRLCRGEVRPSNPVISSSMHRS